jgi:hypothetical protein
MRTGCVSSRESHHEGSQHYGVGEIASAEHTEQPGLPKSTVQQSSCPSKECDKTQHSTQQKHNSTEHPTNTSSFVPFVQSSTLQDVLQHQRRSSTAKLVRESSAANKTDASTAPCQYPHPAASDEMVQLNHHDEDMRAGGGGASAHESHDAAEQRLEYHSVSEELTHSAASAEACVSQAPYNSVTGWRQVPRQSGR